jgi:tRNA/tmRNA/rRNA uracil-C5-methylase (TrmA/RlmC/RlmD family)
LLVPAPGSRSKRLSAILAQLPDDVSVASLDPASGEVLQLRGRTYVQESAAGHEYRVTGDGFWQIHGLAPASLTAAVMDGVAPRAGERVADLYAGAGLFTAPLADAVGVTGNVLSVEGSPAASKDARKNLHGFGQIEIVQGKVERVLRSQAQVLDAVVLDPPRAGAGKAVVQAVASRNPRVVGYVACDPASFARDLGYFLQLGWSLDSLRVFDLYPHTHHMESFAVLTPGGN